MGRVIRKVPKGWEHPKNAEGFYKRIHDQSLKSSIIEWIKEFNENEFDSGKDTAYENATEFLEGYPFPNPEHYLPDFESDPVCFQIYENVTEGTPVSPVFNNEDDMLSWLIEEGYSKEAASTFIKNGWAPTMMLETFPTGEMTLHQDIHSYDRKGE